MYNKHGTCSESWSTVDDVRVRRWGKGDFPPSSCHGRPIRANLISIAIGREGEGRRVWEVRGVQDAVYVILVGLRKFAREQVFSLSLSVSLSLHPVLTLYLIILLESKYDTARYLQVPINSQLHCITQSNQFRITCNIVYAKTRLRPQIYDKHIYLHRSCCTNTDRYTL